MFLCQFNLYYHFLSSYQIDFCFSITFSTIRIDVATLRCSGKVGASNFISNNLRNMCEIAHFLVNCLALRSFY